MSFSHERVRSLQELFSLGKEAKKILTKNKLLHQNISTYNNFLSDAKKYFSQCLINNNNKSTSTFDSVLTNKNLNLKKVKDLTKRNISLLQSLKEKYLKELNNSLNQIELDRIKEDNFIYENEIKSKNYLIKCLKDEIYNTVYGGICENQYIFLDHKVIMNYVTTVGIKYKEEDKEDDIEVLEFEEGEKMMKQKIKYMRNQLVYYMKVLNILKKKVCQKKHDKKKLKTIENKLRNKLLKYNNINRNNSVSDISISMNASSILYSNRANKKKIDYTIFYPFEKELTKNEFNELEEFDLITPRLKTYSPNEIIDEKFIIKKNNNYINKINKPLPLKITGTNSISIKLNNNNKIPNITNLKLNPKSNKNNINDLNIVPKLNLKQISYNKKKVGRNELNNSSSEKHEGEESESNEEKESIQEDNRIRRRSNDFDNVYFNKTKNDYQLEIEIRDLIEQIMELKKRVNKKKEIINGFKEYKKTVRKRFGITVEIMKNLKSNNKNICDNKTILLKEKSFISDRQIKTIEDFLCKNKEK